MYTEAETAETLFAVHYSRSGWETIIGECDGECDGECGLEECSMLPLVFLPPGSGSWSCSSMLTA